jgi:hypothetical protein
MSRQAAEAAKEDIFQPQEPPQVPRVAKQVLSTQ